MNSPSSDPEILLQQAVDGNEQALADLIALTVFRTQSRPLVIQCDVVRVRLQQPIQMPAAREFEREYKISQRAVPRMNALQDAALAWFMAGDMAEYEAACQKLVDLLLEGKADPLSPAAKMLLIVPRPFKLLEWLRILVEQSEAKHEEENPGKWSNNLAWIEFRSGEFEEAETHFATTSKIAFTQSDYFILSMCQFQSGKKPEAQATFDRALARSRQDDDSRTALSQRFNGFAATTSQTVLIMILRKEAEEMLKGTQPDPQETK